ncbi:hypothetical protein BH11PSE11_BH11PSE11_22190 [soil metagenome]
MRTTAKSLLSWLAFTLSLVTGTVAGGAHAAPLTLGPAGSFGVLAASTVTNVGPTVVNGDLGLTPGSSVTGFPPGTIINGSIHINNASATTGKTAANSTYTNLSALPCDFTYGAGTDLSTLSPMAPGVYCFTSSVIITGPVSLLGTLTDQFVFKTGSTLTVANNATMSLVGGIPACNVFWGVGSSATLGANSTLAGNILATVSVTFNTGASLFGGAYSLNSAVTLDTNTVTACGYTPPPTVTSINPTSGATSGGTNATLTGTGFVNGATVTIGGGAATGVTWISATSITLTTPAGTAGAKDVVVTNPDTQFGTLTNGYTYAAAPTVTGINPTNGTTVGGTSVTLTGTNFIIGATTVTIGGASCTAPTVSTTTSMTCTTPAGAAGTSSVLATTSGGTNAANALYTYVAPIRTYTAPSSTGSGTITASFIGGGASCAFVVSRYIPVSGGPGSPPAGTAPAGVSFPHGLFDFTTSGCTAGSTLNFTITYPQALPTGTVYWKYGPTPSDASYHWYQLPAVIAGNTATFGITDGGLGDDDLVANGAVVDQGGPGVPSAASAIPTLSEWEQILLAGLLMMMGMATLRRRRL